jgi:DNA-binding transcriptional regulator PaaX
MALLLDPALARELLPDPWIGEKVAARFSRLHAASAADARVWARLNS